MGVIIIIIVMFFTAWFKNRKPTAIVLGDKIYPIKQRVLDSKPENPDEVFGGYALYCTNKEQYLQCVDNITYDWVDTLEDDGDFLLDANGEPRPFGDFYGGISNFIGSLHCVLVPCKLYRKDVIQTSLFSRDGTYRGRYIEPDFTKSIDFRVYHEGRIMEYEAAEKKSRTRFISASNQMSGVVANSISVVNPVVIPVNPSKTSMPNKPTRTPMPPVKPPKGVIKH